MVRQRVYGILAGYEDCNDHDSLRHDPVFKMVSGSIQEAIGYEKFFLWLLACAVPVYMFGKARWKSV